MQRIVDLSETLREGMRGVRISWAKQLEKDGWNARTLELYSHAGTHMDAPSHFITQAGTIDNLDLSKCIGPAWVIDCTPTGPKDLLDIASIGNYADTIGSGDRVLLRTDWSKVTDPLKYRNDLPRVSLELAQWFAERKIALLGVEPPSVADVNNPEELTAVHRTLLGAEIVIAESLRNLDALTTDKVHLIALPLKVEGGDGAPARVVAMENPGGIA